MKVSTKLSTAPVSRHKCGDATPGKCYVFNMVRVKGLEPPRLAAPEPKSHRKHAFSSTWPARFDRTYRERSVKLTTAPRG